MADAAELRERRRAKVLAREGQKLDSLFYEKKTDSGENKLANRADAGASSTHVVADATEATASASNNDINSCCQPAPYEKENEEAHAKKVIQALAANSKNSEVASAKDDTDASLKDYKVRL